MPWRENDYFIEHKVAAIAEELFLNDDSRSGRSGRSDSGGRSDSSDSGVLVKKNYGTLIEKQCVVPLINVNKQLVCGID